MIANVRRRAASSAGVGTWDPRRRMREVTASPGASVNGGPAHAAATEEIESMFRGIEAGLGGNPAGHGLQLPFELIGDGEVRDLATDSADQVVVMVVGEVVGQLEAGELVDRCDAVDHTARLEHGEVAVGRALGEIAGFDDLGGGERSL